MTPGSIERVSVIGAGAMGHGIAQVAAAAGCRTSLFDADPAAATRALDRIRSNLEKGIERGKVDAATRDRTLAGISAHADLRDAVEAADLVIEAVPEVVDLKARVFRDVEAIASAEALLATNTSALSVGALADQLERPDRFLGLHFFNPVHIMALVEVVRAPSTSDRTLETAVEFVRRIGKEPIVVKDSPGFASSRLGLVLGLEAMRMVEDGVATAEDIDKAMELGYRHPMGPLKLTDLVGLDVRLDIARHLHDTLGSEAFRPPHILERMVDQGLLGKKSGRGFYDWPSE